MNSLKDLSAFFDFDVRNFSEFQKFLIFFSALKEFECLLLSFEFGFYSGVITASSRMRENSGRLNALRKATQKISARFSGISYDFHGACFHEVKDYHAHFSPASAPLRY